MGEDPIPSKYGGLSVVLISEKLWLYFSSLSENKNRLRILKNISNAMPISCLSHLFELKFSNFFPPNLVRSNSVTQLEFGFKQMGRDCRVIFSFFENFLGIDYYLKSK